MKNRDYNFSNISELRTHRFSIGYIAEIGANKFYLKSYQEEFASIKQFQAENYFYKNVANCPNILPFLGEYRISGQTFHVYPFLENDLIDYVRRISEKDLVLRILIPLLDALAFMHKSEFVHGDLKLENVRVSNSDDFEVFICDFGKVLNLDRLNPNRLGSLPQHIPPDTTIGPQFDIYSLGVLAFQLLFGFDFIKNFQMNGRDFNRIPDAQKIDSQLLKFISVATEPSALLRFKSAKHAKEFLLNKGSDEKLVIERYDINHYFEFYYECMRNVFQSSNRTMLDFENFVGLFGEKYYERLRKWAGSPKACLVHFKVGDDLVGVCEGTLKDSETGIVSTLFVRSDYRGQGIAQKIEKHVFQFFKIQGVSRVVLNVTKDNLRARAFYRKAGWEEMLDGEYSGAIQMVKRVCAD